MARASFTLKRYLPINTEAAETSDWAVFNGRPASGASTIGTPVLGGAESFDIILKATSPKWIPTSSAESQQAMFWTGDDQVSQAVFFYIYAADQGAAAGRIGFDISQNSQSGYTMSAVVPFVDGQTYWIKYSFDGESLTGSYFYAEDQPTEPAAWTSLATTTSTLSNLTSYTTMNTTNDIFVGFYDSNTASLDSNFNGTIHRLIVRTRTGITTEYFYYTGASDTWTVPTGVTSVEALLWGGGGNGGQVFGSMSVTPGTSLTLRVGGECNNATGGWPNGGNGGTNSANGTYGNGGGGGSDIKEGSTILMVAGGMGGDVAFDESDPNQRRTSGLFGAGSGSGSTSSFYYTQGLPNGVNGYINSYGGRGGTQTSGGAAGTSDSVNRTAAPTAGSGQQGGNGASTNESSTGGNRYCGGGGGGGYYGGGGGGNDAYLTGRLGYPGGGGSSYVSTSRVSNYKISCRPIVIPNGTQSWNAAGPDSMSSSSFEYVPLIITDTVDGSSGTVIYGPPQPDYDLNAYDGLIVLRWVD